MKTHRARKTSTKLFSCLVWIPIAIPATPASAAAAERRIAAVTPVEGIEVDFFTPRSDSMAKLPKTTTIQLSDGGSATVPLQWELDQPYFPYTYGNYTAIGKFELPERVKQSDPPTTLEVRTRLRMNSGRGLMVLDWEGFNQPGKYEEHQLDLGDGEGERTYYTYVPSSYDGSKAVPVLFDLHGGGSNGLAQWSSSRSDRLAERQGFIVVAPNGYPPAFVAAILDKLEKDYKVDEQRVYAMGVSAGGMGSSRLAVDLSDRIAGIGVISGHFLLSRQAEAGEKLPRAMPMVLFAGTKESTSGPPFRDFVPSMLTAGEWLAKQNGCDPKATITEFPTGPDKLDLDDLPLWTSKDDALTIMKHFPTTVTRHTWSGCDNGHEIVAYAVNGGGHCWPGGNQYVVETTVGPVTHLIDATQLVWEHLSKYRLPE